MFLIEREMIITVTTRRILFYNLPATKRELCVFLGKFVSYPIPFPVNMCKIILSNLCCKRVTSSRIGRSRNTWDLVNPLAQSIKIIKSSNKRKSFKAINSAKLLEPLPRPTDKLSYLIL